MIADKIIPSFYVIEVRGEAATSMFPGDYNIEKVAFGTRDFESDMHAVAAAEKAISSIISDISDKSAQTTADFNPEFFPGATLSDEKKREIEEVQEMADEMNLNLARNNKMAIPITRSFDAMGDFVMSRKKITADSFAIDLRIIANIDHYIKLKTLDQVQKTDATPSNQNPKDNLSIH